MPLIENIYLAIIIASIATFICRGSGVFFSTKLKPDSNLLEFIKCISIGIIVAVIVKIILFPEGLLNQSTIQSRLLGVITLILSYFVFKKNILLSTLLGTIIFYISNILATKLVF